MTEPPVLVVDDDDDIREVIEIALGTHGYRVLTATSGEDCLRALQGSERPCMILLDMMMPSMSGWEVCERLSEDPALSAIPVVILTGGNVPPESCPTARAILRKPIELAPLLEAVGRHAQRSSPACAH